MSEQFKIGIAGAGAWGRGLFSAFSSRYGHITLYSRREDAHGATTNNINDLSELDYLFLVIPAQEIRNFCKTISRVIKPACKIVICAKGIEEGSGKLLYEVVEEELRNNILLALSGPNFADEIIAGLPAISSIACKDMGIAEELAQKFSTKNFILHPTSDIASVSVVGALKNVLAILCGIARGLKIGENGTAAIISKGIKEIFLLAKTKGGKVESVLEPAFIGDVFLTCSSITSRNVQFGLKLVTEYLDKGYEEIITPSTVEGMYTSLSIARHYKEIELPVLKFVFTAITTKFNKQQEIRSALNDIIFT